MKTIRLFIALCVLLICIGNSFGSENDNKHVLIDVRTLAEWKEGHLDGAILIPHDQIEQKITEVVSDKKTKIYLYCRSGRRTGIALDILKKVGYVDVINLGTQEEAAKILNIRIIK